MRYAKGHEGDRTVYGTGHASLTSSLDGSEEDDVVYNAQTTANLSANINRTAGMQ